MSVLSNVSGVATSAGQVAGRKAKGSGHTFWIWLFLIPTVVLYGAFTVYPIIASYWYSLLQWDGFGQSKTFIGLQNYRDVFADPLFWNSFKITLVFMLVAVPVKVALTLFVALVLNSPNMPFPTFFRTVLFLPVVTTTAIVGIVMQFVFDPASGPINKILMDMHLRSHGIDFLGSSSTALWTICGVYVWKGFGITLVYWLAALQTVPADLRDAARVDGADAWQNFRYVTLPILRPFAIIITLLSLEESLKIFDLALTMTNGGPYFSTEVVEIYIYQHGFTLTPPQLGFASAAAVIFGLFVCAVGLFQLIGIQAVRKARE